MKRFIVLLALLTCVNAQAWNDGWQKGDLTLPGSTSLPSTCTDKQIYIDTDATSGQQLYVCESGSWVAQGAAGASVSDAVYGSGWDGVTTVSPSKNSVYDKIETISLGASGWTDGGANVYNTATTDNVGIGTTTPASNVKLDVRGNTRIWDNTGTVDQATGVKDLYVQGKLEVDGTTYATLAAGTLVGATNICLQDGTNCAAASGNGWTDGGVNIFPSLTTDVVGIGTTTPNAASFEIVKQSTTVPLKVSATASGGGNYLIVTSGGNVGIGTTLPGTLLDVQGQIRATSLSISGTAGITQFANSSGFGFDSNAATYTTGDLFIDPQTNVGIGTANPTRKLEVNGDINASNYYGNGSNLTGIGAGGWTDGGTNVYLATTTDTVGIGTTTPNNASLEIVKQGSTPPLKISATASGNGNYFTVTSSGNVGIGTISPEYSLVASATAGAKFVLKNSSTTAFGEFDVYTDQGDTLDFGCAGSTASGISSRCYVSQNLNAPLIFTTNGNGAAPMLMMTGAGNVGIGTTKPSKQMVVKGGDLWIDNTSGKLIMVSPDASCSSCGPDNSDVWSCSSVTCPAR